MSLAQGTAVNLPCLALVGGTIKDDLGTNVGEYFRETMKRLKTENKEVLMNNIPGDHIMKARPNTIKFKNTHIRPYYSNNVRRVPINMADEEKRMIRDMEGVGIIRKQEDYTEWRTQETDRSPFDDRLHRAE